MDPSPAASLQRRQDLFATYVLPELEVLLRVALSLTRRTVDAEDLVQDTLLRAYQGIEGFDGAHPRAWLMTIMRNAQINATRRRRPTLLDDPDAADRSTVGANSPEDTPEALVVGEMFETVIGDALSALPDRFRQVVVMVDINGLSYAETAEALGIPVGTVMSRLHRARNRMRHRLAAAGLAPRRRG